MRSCKFFVLLFIFISSFTPKSYATVVLIDPPVQDSPSVGDKLAVRIKAEDVVDLFAYQFELVFDRSALKFANIEEGEFLKADGADTFPILSSPIGPSAGFQNITSDVINGINSSGSLIVANARLGQGIKGVSGTGDLVSISFEVLKAKASELLLKHAFENPDQNPVLIDSNVRAITTELTGGVINQLPACLKGDVSGDNSIGPNDAILVLRISAGLLAPTSQQQCAADVNNDGKIDSADAIRILRKSIGLEPAPIKIGSPSASAVNIKLPDVYGAEGRNVTVSVEVDNIDAIAGGDISVSYDSSVLHATDVLCPSGIMLASNISEPGIVKLAFVCLENQNGETLAKIQFDVLSDSVSPLVFQRVELYRPDLLPVVSKRADGKFISWAMPPKNSALLQNFPNPFNPDTWIPYQLKSACEVTIQIYSITGERVRELLLGYKPAGTYVTKDRAAYWDGKDKFGTPVASGIYFYSIKAGDFSTTRKLIVLK